MSADGLRVRRLYIDSRFRSTGTTDDFEIQLSEGVELPAGCHCYLSEWTGTVSWETISESNQNLYLSESGSGVSLRIVQLPTGPHDSESLRVVIQDALNSGKPAGIGTYSVQRSSSAGSSSTASLGSAAFRFYTISLSSGTFTVIPDVLLETPAWQTGVWRAGGGPEYDISAVRSTNELFKFTDGLDYRSSHVSSFVDLRSKHSIFLHSSLGNSDSMSVSGLRSILGKIPVDSPYGSIIHYQHSSSPYDMTSIGPTFMQRPRFYLRDARNQRLNLAGGHWSATIVFCMA
jgi:hypothetical protein